MSPTTDRIGDNRWNLCLDALIAAWNRAGPDATLGALRDLELSEGADGKDAATGDEAARPRNPLAALERYPVSLAACPHCDSPYGTVHGPGCPLDPEKDAGPECQVACDADCEIAPVHCWNRHRPNHKPDWHDPVACDSGKSAATGTEGTA